MSWTDERTDLLKSLWLGGHPASIISTRFGDVTRHAVIGKVHRLGLRRKDSSRPFLTRTVPLAPRNKRNSRRRRPRNKRPRLLPHQRRPPHPPKENLAQIVFRLKPRDCRWPIGDPFEEGFHFCGNRAVADFPYCACHLAEATRPAPRKRSSLSN
jgi:GcrA cell cycle regulator